MHDVEVAGAQLGQDLNLTRDDGNDGLGQGALHQLRQEGEQETEGSGGWGEGGVRTAVYTRQLNDATVTEVGIPFYLWAYNGEKWHKA